MSEPSDLQELTKEKPFIRTLRELAAAAPDALAITCEGRSVTRAELDCASNRLARAYETAGVDLGDFVTIALPNSIAFYEAVIACWKVGAVPQPISPRLPLAERRAIVELADSKMVIGASPDEHPGRQCLPADYTPDTSLSDEPLDERVSPIFKAMTSGGSTGRPKLILSGTPAVGAAGMGMLFHMAPSDRHLVSGPLYHNASFILSIAGMLLGQHLVVMPKFDAQQALSLIQSHRITWSILVPTMMARMLKVIEAQTTRFDLSSLRICWHMGAPCAAWLKEAWIALLGAEQLWELYGGTEAIASTAINGKEWLEHRGSVGKPVWGSQMKVLNEAGEIAAPGEVGEIYMRGPQGAKPTYQYVGARKREKDGWESLGDLGWMDEQGYLYISDRRTDMIVSGGVNVFPAEVEAVLDAHPKVRSCAVVGLPDDDLGQRVHAVVHAEPGLTSEELLELLSQRLVRYKIPRSIEFVCEHLRDDAGKVRRSAIRDAAVERYRTEPNQSAVGTGRNPCR